MEQSWRVAELLEEIARKADPASVLKKAIANGNRSGSMVSATVVFGGDECTAVYGFPLDRLIEGVEGTPEEVVEWIKTGTTENEHVSIGTVLNKPTLLILQRRKDKYLAQELRQLMGMEKQT